MNGYSQSVRDDDGSPLRRYEYDEETLLVADLGAVEGTVDLVDGTAIVVTGGDQYEFDVPAGTSRAIMNNGIVTIEVEDTR